MPFSEKQIRSLNSIEEYPLLEIPKKENISIDLKDLIFQMFKISTKERIHFSELKNHNWFKKSFLSLFIS